MKIVDQEGLRPGDLIIRAYELTGHKSISKKRWTKGEGLVLAKMNPKGAHTVFILRANGSMSDKIGLFEGDEFEVIR